MGQEDDLETRRQARSKWRLAQLNSVVYFSESQSPIGIVLGIAATKERSVKDVSLLGVLSVHACPTIRTWLPRTTLRICVTRELMSPSPESLLCVSVSAMLYASIPDDSEVAGLSCLLKMPDELETEPRLLSKQEEIEALKMGQVEAGGAQTSDTSLSAPSKWRRSGKKGCQCPSRRDPLTLPQVVRRHSLLRSDGVDLTPCLWFMKCCRQYRYRLQVACTLESASSHDVVDRIST